MKYCLIILLTILNTTLTCAANSEKFAQVFSKFCTNPDGQMIPTDAARESLEQVGINLPSFEGSGWISKYVAGTAWVKPMQDFINDVTSDLPHEALQLAAINGMNTFLIYADRSSNLFNSKEEELAISGQVKVLIIWQTTFLGVASAFYGTIDATEFKYISGGNLSSTYFGVTLQPMPKNVFEFMMEAGTI
ncbi:MAG: hypothetical protein HDS26_03965 [Bacteroides sp.]|nr:hypothetical protein [Bacteroides sp.]MBD5307542.1 hypothetical protein [Bacteroides sp.]